MKITNCFSPADILIPKQQYLEKWSVVACDQFTSQQDYWDETKNIIGDGVSAFHITFPEIYLENGDFDARILNINNTMKKYINDDIFDIHHNSLILTVRETLNKKKRIGLIGKIDLECYDYIKGSTSLVRATEGTVLDRIPPRVKIRENACLESPHIMILIDDENSSIIEPLYEKVNSFKQIYDFDLMQKGGRITGYLIGDDIKTSILDSLETINDSDKYKTRYKTNKDGVLQYAVGDGNHSLATAKKCYENLKEQTGYENALNSNARYALVEIVNLHSDALEFEPIHRVVFDCDKQLFLDEINTYFNSQEITISNKFIKENGAHTFTCIFDDSFAYITIKKPKLSLTVASLQEFLDDFVDKHSLKIDYIHGKDVVEQLCKQGNNIGFILPDFEKSDLFKTVINDGALPKKTFSMGEACEKRYYLESRIIK